MNKVIWRQELINDIVRIQKEVVKDHPKYKALYKTGEAEHRKDLSNLTDDRLLEVSSNYQKFK